MNNNFILIKPASGSCNMSCSYCFYKKLCEKWENPDKGVMTTDTFRALLKYAFSNAATDLTLAFQGGEPALAGLSFFQMAVSAEKELNTKNIPVQNTFQTNGLLLNENWAAFFKKNNFLIGLSLDGPKEFHDAYRKDHFGFGTFDKVMGTAELLNSFDVPFNIVSVITKKSVNYAKRLYDFYLENDFQYVQLIPCMGNESSAAPSSEEYGRFLCDFFDLWYAGGIDRLNVRLFSDLARMAAGYPTEECGIDGQCCGYLTVEADGSLYPCDFHCLDECKLGNINTPALIKMNSPSPSGNLSCRLTSSEQLFLPHAAERLWEIGQIYA